MAERSRELGSPGPDPGAGVTAGLNVVLPGYAVLYHQGRPVLVRDEDRAQLELELGLIPEQHDVEAAVNEVNVHYQAVGDTLAANLAEIGKVGHLLDEADAAMSAAVGAFIDRWRWLQRSLAGTLPTEGLVRAVAEHKALHGSLDAVPTLARYEALADAYLGAHPADLAALRARATADNQQAAQQLVARAAGMLTDDPQRAEALRTQAQRLLGGDQP